MTKHYNRKRSSLNKEKHIELRETRKGSDSGDIFIYIHNRKKNTLNYCHTDIWGEKITWYSHLCPSEGDIV